MLKKTILPIAILILVTAACSAQSTQTTQARPTSAPTQIVKPVLTPSPERRLPQSEAEVPRVSVEEAKAALDSGAAVVVDVRDPGDYQASHITGAISIPLAEIEKNPVGLSLHKDQWIITYCT